MAKKKGKPLSVGNKKSKKSPSAGSRTRQMPAMSASSKKKTSPSSAGRSGVMPTVKRKISSTGTMSKPSRSSRSGKKKKTPLPKGDHTVHIAIPRRQGMGLATKLTIFIVILLVPIIGISQFLSYNKVINTYSKQLNKSGAQLAGALLNLDSDALMISEKDRKLLKTVKNDFLKNSYITYDELKEKMGADPKKYVEDDVSQKFGEMIAKYSSVDVKSIFFSRGTQVVFGEERSISAPLIGSIGKVDIQEGTMSLNGVVSPIRAYSKTKDGMTVKVILDNSVIASVQSDMRMTAIIIGVLSIIVGIAGVSLLSHQVTRPINDLANDMIQVARGDLGHTSRVNVSDEVGVLAKTFNLMSKDLEISHEAELQKIEQDRDLELAKNVQISLVPTKVPQIDNFSVAPYYRSAKEVGGDYYDIVQMDEDHTALFVADVSGKGVQGAMIMAMTRGIAHSETKACTNFSPSWILSQVNRNLARDLKPGSFVTAMCLIVNHKTGIGKLASAGHNPLVVVRHKTKKFDTFNPTGIALGFDKGPLFNRTIKDMDVTINLGDRVVLYTDGVPEAMSENKEEYGMERFERFCTKYATLKSDVFVEQLVNDLDKHKGNGPQHDDITIITLRKLK